MNMKVGVLSDGDDLSSEVSEDFGHAPYFLIVDYMTHWITKWSRMSSWMRKAQV